jgi:hypothetical protein
MRVGWRYGINLEEPRGRWTQIYFETLRSIKFENHWMKESFNRLLELYEFLSGQIDKQTQLFRELSETPLYQERVDEEIFSFIHGSHERGCLFYLEQSIG